MKIIKITIKEITTTMKRILKMIMIMIYEECEKKNLKLQFPWQKKINL